MTILSERDIVKQLGNGIYIYPFKGVSDSFSGCCLKLTASRFAYTVEPLSENLEHGDYKKEAKPLIDPLGEDKFFLIPPGKTALVWTNESILLDGWFCGSIHSKVNIVARGVGHIGTRVNPYWGGVLSISLHNISKKPIKINVGEPIAYMRFYKLNSESLEGQTQAHARKNASAKLQDAFPPGCDTPEQLTKWIEEEAKGWRYGLEESFKDALEKEKRTEKEVNEYQKAKRKYNSFFYFSPYKEISWQIIFYVIFGIINVIISLFNIYLNLKSNS